MARPFPTTFDKDSQMNSQSGSSNPISYQANVNRQKTKKWAEAKPVSYGGDDWGDDDDYEYDEPEPAPAPAAKPTGLRQQGHTLQSPIQSGSPTVDNNKKAYGDLPALPGADSRPRANSFDADDEKRNFSANNAIPASAQQPPPGVPPTRFSQITGVPTVRNTSGPPALSVSTQQSQAPTGLRQPPQAMSPIADSPRTSSQQETTVRPNDPASVTSPSSEQRSSSGNHQTMRDFSPSAVPAPLSARSPAPQSATDQPATRFPARKSSLGQSSAPILADITGPSQDASMQKPWSAGRDSSPGPRVTSPSSATAKALPFIRPADIYRRAEEERRQSQDSGRPSLDSVVGTRPGERPESPGKSQLRERLSSDSLGGRKRASMEGDETSGSGRHLMPSLEPVKERKSEYGFEGYNVSDHTPNPTGNAGSAPQDTMSNAAQLDVQEARRQSTSPKLPDLNRLSGFGMDMFMQPSSQETQTQAPAIQTAHDDSLLPRQPSIGLRSVVNQAFDRIDDGSVPPTPASVASSNVRRADSDSTGTGGISPIMNNGPRPNETHASISEVVEEPQESRPLSGVHTSEPGIPGFKPGHRRDISTPSPGNSPARTPDVAVTDNPIKEQQAIVSSRFAEASQGSAADDLPPPRPGAHSEHSFRPALPGGWDSYATSARTATPQPEDKPAPPPKNDDSDEYDLTPTTTKRSLPQSAIGAAAGAAFGGRAMKGKHDTDSPVTSPLDESTPAPNRDAMPTPDLTMAPGGSIYAGNSVDPRLLPRMEQAPPETQFRPDIVHRDLSGDSSEPPAPLPKDSPIPPSKPAAAGYFPTAQAQRKASVDSWEQDIDEEPTVHQQNIPAVVTKQSSDQEENDRLQEEIVRRLSPQPSDNNPLENTLSPSQPSDATRESTYLPAEYGDYWASTNEDQPTRPLSIAHPVDSKQTLGAQGLPSGSSIQGETDAQSVAPLTVDRSEPSQPATARPPIQTRFSWEQSTESVPNLPAASAQHTLNETAEPVSQNEPREIPSADHGPEVVPGNSQPSPIYGDEKIAVGAGESPNVRDSSERNLTGQEAAYIGGGAALAAKESSNTQPERRLSLAEEKATRVSSYPINPTPPEDEHPSNTPQMVQSPNLEPPTQPPVSNTASPITPSPAAGAGRLLAFKEIAAMKSAHQRIQTFDETRHRFAAMDSGLSDWMATLRTQHPEHANATGSWAGTGKAQPINKPGGGVSQPLQQPYYQQYLNASSPSSPSTPTGKPGPSAPAAYQQQGFSPAGPSKLTSQQVQAKGKEFLHTAGIFGGKAGKAGKGLLAKGKNKLRGGGGDKSSPPPKARNEKPDRRTSWALPLSLSKSASRNDTSPSRDSKDSTPVPMHDTHRSNTMTSIDSRPPQLPPAQTGESFGSLSGVLPSNSSQGNWNSSHPSLPPINTETSRRSSELTATVREIEDADQSTTESESQENDERRDEVEDTLRPPAPIGKYQPSWDPFNATPIAEEQGSAYDTQPRQSYPFPSAAVAQPAHLAQPTKLPESPEALPNSDRSNSEETNFHDAVETQIQKEPENDWVMVNAENAPKEEAVESGPFQHQEEQSSSSIMHRPRGSNYDVPILASDAISPGNTAVSSEIPSRTLHHKESETRSIREQFQQGQYQKQPEQRPEQEFQGSDSTFLPPIRRTSTFGFKFGSRQSKQRFPIDDDDDDEIGITPPIPDMDSRRKSGSGGTSGFDNRPRNSMENRTPTMDTSHFPETQSPVSPTRPPLIQATSSEYSQRTNEGVPEDDYQLRGQQNYQNPPAPLISPINTSTHGQPTNNDTTQPRRPSLGHSQSSSQSQRTLTQPQVYQPQGQPSRPDDISPPPENFRRSQDAWRPNMGSPTQASPPKQSFAGSSAPRQSWEAQRPRGFSGSGRDYPQRPDGWIPQQSKAFEQPPSSAQRYPELFKTEQQSYDGYDKETGDLPAHYYQPPIPREAAFLPRQQTNEYQLPGVGPPPDHPRENTRRNSSFFKEMGGKLARGTSKERRTSISRDDDNDPPPAIVPSEESREKDNRRSSFFRGLNRSSTGGLVPPQSREGSSSRKRSESRGNEYAGSIIASDDGREYKNRENRRSGFFRGLNRSSTGVLVQPQSRENIVANNPGSKTDLFSFPQPSPNTAQERKRSLFGSASAESNPKPNKLSRASTSGLPDATTGKKKRFSGLSGFFGKSNASRSSLSSEPQNTRELPHQDRRPIESPQIGPRVPAQQQPLGNQNADMFTHPGSRTPSHPNQQQPLPNNYNTQIFPQYQDDSNVARQYDHRGQEGQTIQNTRISSQGSRNVLNKLSLNTEAPPQSQQQESRPRKSSKTRRSSAAGLLSGIIGRRSTQQDDKSEDSRSQGSQPQAPQFVPPAQTYSDLRDDSPLRSAQPQQPSAPPAQDQTRIRQERGRQVSREEPQYDSVPIPGGYSLVRGQGAQQVRTEYDPRGHRFQESDRGVSQQALQNQSPNLPHIQQQPQQQQYTQQQFQQFPQPQQATQYTGNQRLPPASQQHVANLQAPMAPRSKQSPPHLAALETYHNYISRQSPSRLSTEDLIARSPARSPEGQQRPYQLSLPEDDEDRDYPVSHNLSATSQPRSPFANITPVPNIIPVPKPHHNAVQRLQSPSKPPPQLRHPESPAGYPLPDDVIFSPVNPSANDMPPPPPPKDAPRGQDYGSNLSHSLSQNSYLTTMDLNRSATHRTAVSAVSGMSDPPSQSGDFSARRESGGLNVPNQKTASDGDRNVSSPSPTPPSPAGTPEPHVRNTVVDAPRRESLDLYDASPRHTYTSNNHSNGYAQSGPSNYNQPESVNSNNIESQRKLAELEGTKADGFQMRVRPQEEKIFYDAESGMRGPQGRDPDDNPVVMSATSYPGQEWNPYPPYGGYDDDSR